MSIFSFLDDNLSKYQWIFTKLGKCIDIVEICFGIASDGCHSHGCHLENLFFASSPEPKGQLSQNLVGSFGVTRRSKIAKIVPIGNPRWPPWPPSSKSIFGFFSCTERPNDSKLGRKHGGDW